MLSRRNIRIKIMQLLYAKRLDEALTYDIMKTRYLESIGQSFDLYLFNILQLMHITKFSLNDASKRSSKYLPTDEDRNFKPKVFENELVDTLSKSEPFQKICKKKSLISKIDKDMTRLFYTEFAKKEEYASYMLAEPDNDKHKEILLELYRFCMGNETYNDYMEDSFENWIHDKSLIVGTVKKTIKALPSTDDFFMKYYPPEETTKDFGEELLHKSNFFDEELLEIIKPALKNWDADRVAIIDLILLKLALSEMMYFPTIPVKVTINEFVDISKIYSTPKSKDFINGILDRLMKKLVKDGRIKKEGRGLID